MLRWHANCYWAWQEGETSEFLKSQQAVVDSAKALFMEGCCGSRISERFKIESMQHTMRSENCTTATSFRSKSKDSRRASMVSLIACNSAHGYGTPGEQANVSSAYCFRSLRSYSTGDALIESCCASHSFSEVEVVMYSGSSAGSLFSSLLTEGTGILRSTKVPASGRRFFLAGNWKCNGLHACVTRLVDKLNAADLDDDVDVVVCLPYWRPSRSGAGVRLAQVLASVTPRVEVAAQNRWTGEGGLFTGEISADQLADPGVQGVVTGHAERRHVVGESNAMVALKAWYAEAVRARGECAAVAKQVTEWSKVVIAYEPVWAIGTGRTCSPQQAQEVHAVIRKCVGKNASARAASSVKIIYGASVLSLNHEDWHYFGPNLVLILNRRI